MLVQVGNSAGVIDVFRRVDAVIYGVYRKIAAQRVLFDVARENYVRRRMRARIYGITVNAESRVFRLKTPVFAAQNFDRAQFFVEIF